MEKEEACPKGGGKNLGRIGQKESSFQKLGDLIVKGGERAGFLGDPRVESDIDIEENQEGMAEDLGGR